MLLLEEAVVLARLEYLLHLILLLVVMAVLVKHPPLQGLA
jgi:hypothetical protein